MTSLEDVKRVAKVYYDPYKHAKKLASEGYGIDDICEKTGVHEDIAWAFITLYWNDQLRHRVYRV